MRQFKYVFIGAGPATLAALSNLSSDDAASSVVLEAGSIKRKVCPSLKAHNCSSCSETLCPVLNGVGGASYGFGNKFCEFPASRHVVKNVTQKELSNISTSLSKEVSQQNLLTAESSLSIHTGYPNRKHYQANIALADEYRNFIDVMIERVFEKVALVQNFVVSDIKFQSNAFHITSKSGDRISAENTILATGRSGHSLIREVLPKLGVTISDNLADVGFRISTNTSNFADNFFYQNDPKYKFTFEKLGSARTFCTCKGGRIIPVKFGDGYFADGAFVRKVTNQTNVALMARSKHVISYSALEDWCKSINSNSNGSLKIGEFSFDELTDTQVASAIIDLMPKGLSNEHDLILEKLVKLLVNSSKLKMFNSLGGRVGVVKIFGPSVDRYWPQVDMNAPLIKGGRLAIIGDAAGNSRGIYQALAAGKLWGHRKLVEQAECNASLMNLKANVR